MFTIHYSDSLMNRTNCLYPHSVKVSDTESLQKAVSKDYVCAFYKDNYRSNANFLGSDCLALDCDNDHSDEPSKWVDVADVKEAFKDVNFAVHYSRNHQRDKGTKKARPRFHILFLYPFGDS
ncbi:MAG: DNA primase, partial [Bacilli bacterium]